MMYLDTVFCPCNICEKNNYCSVETNILYYYELCVNAHKEAEKFEKFIGNHRPAGIVNNKANLQQYTIFDQLVEDRGNANILLAPVSTFKRHRP